MIIGKRNDARYTRARGRCLLYPLSGVQRPSIRYSNRRVPILGIVDHGNEPSLGNIGTARGLGFASANNDYSNMVTWIYGESKLVRGCRGNFIQSVIYWSRADSENTRIPILRGSRLDQTFAAMSVNADPSIRVRPGIVCHSWNSPVSNDLGKWTPVDYVAGPIGGVLTVRISISTGSRRGNSLDDNLGDTGIHSPKDADNAFWQVDGFRYRLNNSRRAELKSYSIKFQENVRASDHSYSSPINLQSQPDRRIAIHQY